MFLILKIVSTFDQSDTEKFHTRRHVVQYLLLPSQCPSGHLFLCLNLYFLRKETYPYSFEIRSIFFPLENYKKKKKIKESYWILLKNSNNFIWNENFIFTSSLIRYIKTKEYILSFIKMKIYVTQSSLWNAQENKKMLGNFQYGSTSEFRYIERVNIAHVRNYQ